MRKNGLIKIKYLCWIPAFIPIFLSLCLSFSIALGSSEDETTPNLILEKALLARHFRPTPHARILAQWRKEFGQRNEIWVIKYLRNFVKLLADAGLSHDGQMEFLRLLNQKMTSLEIADAISHYDTRNAQAIVVIPKQFKESLPPQVLGQVYKYLYFTNASCMNMSFDSLQTARNYIKKGVSEKKLQILLSNTYLIEGQYVFFFTPDVWPLLGKHHQDFFFESMVSRNRPNALQLTLDISISDNLSLLAERLAGWRNPLQLEKRFQSLLEKSGTGTIRIPLEHFLPKFVRDNAHKFNPCTGPNCFNAALAIYQGAHARKEFEIDLNKLRKRIDDNFDPLPESESIKLGDLLVYEKQNGELIHLATAITENIVFTKNGYSRFQPYIFQRRSTMENLYYPNGNVNVKVYRIKSGSTIFGKGFGTSSAKTCARIFS